MTSSTSSSDSLESSASTDSIRGGGEFHSNVDGATVWLPDGPDLPGDPVHRDPAACTLILLFLVSVAFVVFRSDPRPAVAPDWFFMQKIEWQGVAGTALAGDSRVYRGLSPAALEESLPTPVRNLGFSSATFSDEYLAFVRSTIDDDVESPVIILGITPFSFTSREAGFEDARTKNDARSVPLWFLRTVDFDHGLAPVDPALIVPLIGIDAVQRATAESYRQVFHDDGWVESDRQVENPHVTWRADLPEFAAAWPTDRDRIKGLIKAVEDWTQEGITVAAFCPPIPDESHRLESELWSIDYHTLGEEIERAGGIWVENPDVSSYRIYDGSHLDAESARRFSEVLGSEIARRVEGRRPSPIE